MYIVQITKPLIWQRSLAVASVGKDKNCNYYLMTVFFYISLRRPKANLRLILKTMAIFFWALIAACPFADGCYALLASEQQGGRLPHSLCPGCCAMPWVAAFNEASQSHAVEDWGERTGCEHLMGHRKVVSGAGRRHKAGVWAMADRRVLSRGFSCCCGA